MTKIRMLTLLLLVATVVAFSPGRALADDASGVGDTLLIGALVGAGVGLVIGIIYALSNKPSPTASATASHNSPSWTDAEAQPKRSSETTAANRCNTTLVRF